MTFMEGQDPYLALCHPPMFASSFLTRVCASSEGKWQQGSSTLLTRRRIVPKGVLKVTRAKVIWCIDIQ